MITLYVLLVLAFSIHGSQSDENFCGPEACFLYNNSKGLDSRSPHIKLLLLRYFSELDLLKFTPNLEFLNAFNCSSDFNMEVFPEMPNLNKVEIKNCHISELRKYQFGNAIKLDELKLARNSIERLSNETFHQLSRLRFLNLQDNLIEVLPERVFYPLESLYWLNLTNNRISSLTEDLFFRNEHLRALYLRGNPLKALSLVFPWTNMKIVELDLRDCDQLRDLRLPIILTDLHLKNTGVERLQISGGINSINDENSNVTHVDLHGAFLERSIVEILCNMQSLEWLDLSKSSQSFENHVFNRDENENGCYFPNLRFLNLSGKNLKYIARRLPLFGPNLTTLDLSHNLLDDRSLEYLFKLDTPQESEGNFPNLGFLNFSRNKLKNIPRRFPLFGPNLATLDLSHNLLENVSLESFAEVQSLQSLYLEGNRLKTFDYQSFRVGLKTLKELALFDNRFNATFYANMTKCFGDTGLRLVQEENKI